MATFSNYATLSYTGGTATSNTVTGEILEVLSASKTAVTDSYMTNGSITYIISLTNSGNTALNGITLTDNLGAYTFNNATVYPLEYTDNSVKYYVNGVIQTSPAVTVGPPMTVSGLTVPANGNAIIIYESQVTDYAPLGQEATVTNTVTVTGTGITTPVTATETVGMANLSDLRISKAVNPITVTENGQLTYTFTIQNFGSVEATLNDAVVLSDTFNPVLNDITVTFNNVIWTLGTNYNYNSTTGVFSTVAGQITVPAATYSQNTAGIWTVTPGTAVLTVSGTV